MTDEDTPEPLIEMDAFELRWQLVHGLHPSDGLVAHVIDEHTLMVVGTDSTKHPKHGLYAATGRYLTLRHDARLRPGMSWIVTRGEAHGFRGGKRRLGVLADLANDLAWVRRRTDP